MNRAVSSIVLSLCVLAASVLALPSPARAAEAAPAPSAEAASSTAKPSAPAAPAAANGVQTHMTNADAQSLFREATDACQREEDPDPNGCIDTYHRILSAGFASADLYYNLGTALLRQNRLGPAILYLERALRMSPDDADVLANLAIARKFRVDLLKDAPEEAEAGSGDTVSSVSSQIVQNTRADLWTATFLALWLLGWVLVFVRRASASHATPLLFTGVTLLLLSLPAAAVVACHLWSADHEQDAVVLADVLPVREGPGNGFRTGFEIHEGLTVQITDQESGFQRIRLSNGLQGWVPAQGLAKIKGNAPVAIRK